MSGELARRDLADARASHPGHVPRRSTGRQPAPPRRRPALRSVERRLEVAVRALERLVAPVETAAHLGGLLQGGRSTVRTSASRGLDLPSACARAKIAAMRSRSSSARASFASVSVARRATRASRKGGRAAGTRRASACRDADAPRMRTEAIALVQLAKCGGERAETEEEAKRAMEVRCSDHPSAYAPGGAVLSTYPAGSVDTSRQFRLSSPWPRDSIGVVQRDMDGLLRGIQPAPLCHRRRNHHPRRFASTVRSSSSVISRSARHGNACSPERLGPPDVSDPRDQSLIEESVADGQPDRPGGVGQPCGRSPAGGRGCPARASALRGHSAPAPSRPTAPPPRPPRSTSQGRPRLDAPLAYRPAASHPQMAPQHEAAVEPKDEVLSDRLDALEVVSRRAARRHRSPPPVDGASRPRASHRPTAATGGPRGGVRHPRARP